MKYLLLSALCVLLTVSEINAQAVYKKLVTAEVYYGMPDWWKWLFREAYKNQGIYDISYQSKGPFGLRGEYIFSRRTGIGLDFWYVSSSIRGTYSSTTTAAPTYYFSASIARYNVVPRMVFHLGNHARLDPYLHVGLGVAIFNVSYRTSNTSGSGLNEPGVTVSPRLGLGVKYYFTPSVGAVVDAGLFGPAFSFGLFIKLSKDKNETLLPH